MGLSIGIYWMNSESALSFDCPLSKCYKGLFCIPEVENSTITLTLSFSVELKCQ